MQAAEELKEITTDYLLIQKINKNIPMKTLGTANKAASLRFFTIQANRLCLVDSTNG